MAKTDEFLTDIKKRDVKFVNLQFIDIHGAIKSITINTHKHDETSLICDVLNNGLWFDGSSVEGFVRIYESDMLLIPDLSTYRILPWSVADRKKAQIICDVYTPDGKPFIGDPRSILKRMVAEAKKQNFVFKVGAEVEFYLFERAKLPLPAPHDYKSYIDYTPQSRATDICEEVIEHLYRLGIYSEVHHHEVGPGQHEIDLKYDDALKTADNIQALKITLKQRTSAHHCNLMCSFMPKPIFGQAGSGMHVHQSLFDPKSENNLFFDPEGEFKLSSLALHFLAGQIKHAKALRAITSPIVNSDKRLASGFEAPSLIYWGQKNRAGLFRVPEFNSTKKQAARLEIRCPDPYCNPYLAFACMLAAGLEGIKKKTDLPKPIKIRDEDEFIHFPEKVEELGIETLPLNLNEATNALVKDTLLRKTLGDHAFSKIIEAQRQAWEEYEKAYLLRPSAWEIEKYL